MNTFSGIFVWFLILRDVWRALPVGVKRFQGVALGSGSVEEYGMACRWCSGRGGLFVVWFKGMRVRSGFLPVFFSLVCAAVLLCLPFPPVAAQGVTDTEAVLAADAEKGDARTKRTLGMRYAMGRGVAADDAKAQRWLLEAAQEGDAVAQVSLAAMMAFESDVQDVSGAMGWFEKAAGQGNTQAMSELAQMLESGLGAERDTEKAGVWRERAKEGTGAARLARAWRLAATGGEAWRVAIPVRATKGVATGVDTPENRGIALGVRAVGRDVERGNPAARTVGALLLATGNGVKRDEALAAEWFTQAAEAGYPPAQAVLGGLYAMGWGPLKADEEAAARWMKSAAVQGLHEAQVGYGMMLAGGKGVVQDRQEASGWIRRAAEAGNGRAQLMMAMDAMARDEREEAAQWFCRAAENGDDDVLSLLGVMYGKGEAAVAGESEKLTEVRRYAQRGEPEAQLMLGLMYQEGWGTSRDTAAAERWFSAAKEKGYLDVLVPMGLLYAETGRLAEAEEAFGKAVKMKALSFVRDGGILQLVFGDDRESVDDAPAMKAAGVSQEDAAHRRERIRSKLAFLERMSASGNAAAGMMLGMLQERGWGMPQDEGAGRKLRGESVRNLCAGSGGVAADVPECVPEDGGVVRSGTAGGRNGKGVPSGKVREVKRSMKAGR